MPKHARAQESAKKYTNGNDCEVNKWKRLPIKQFINNMLEYMKITVSAEITKDPFSQKIVFSRKVVERAKRLFESSRFKWED
jgi:hypothetical protein